MTKVSVNYGTLLVFCLKRDNTGIRHNIPGWLATMYVRLFWRHSVAIKLKYSAYFDNLVVGNAFFQREKNFKFRLSLGGALT